MRTFTTALLLVAATAAPALAASEIPAFVGPNAPLVGAIHDARTGEALTPEIVAAMVAEADLVLLGERHDNPDHHALQAWATGVAAAAHPEGRLVLEMVRRGEDVPLAEASAQDVEALGEALAWEANGWPDFAMYAPILEAALEADWTLHAGDVDRETMGALASDTDPLGETERARLALDAPLPDAALATMEQAIVEGHCGLLPDEAVPGFVAAQRLRDASLADALLEAPSPAVLIAGAGHVGPEAVPFYLAARAPERETLTIAFVEAPADVEEPGALAPGFGTQDAPVDIAWFTPAIERGDVCASLRERFAPAD
ncbi:ChaN family lipoprotein [Salinarimonas ramus]|uniref:Haem-binding uptake Tiki superfamily ChaN domain-containing protein n=1 Tax=Salinarimonas ramus TaxID=690164 RepID=A0A917QFH9_9HYPH|nr:ChaN family lipoprotein [Salinarimonas ramus]GGK48384.1 hypothetical protein GCM10011322_39200 [Salinarimonas ramus]